MLLTQDIVLYSLSCKYPTCSLTHYSAAVPLARPVFFEPERPLDGAVVIISLEELQGLCDLPPCTSTLFVCPGTGAMPSRLPRAPVLAVNAQLTLESLSNGLHALFNLFDQWDEALKTVCYEGGNFSDLIDRCDTVIVDPVSLFDKAFHYAGYSKLSEERGLLMFVDENNRVPLDIVNNFVTGNGFPKAYEYKEVFAHPFLLGDVLCRNIFYRDEFVGRLHIQPNNYEEPRIKYSMAILEHLAIYTEKLYARYGSFNLQDIALSSLCSLLVGCLSGEMPSEPKVDAAFAGNGWCVTDTLLLVQFRPNHRYDKNLYAAYLGSEIIRQWQGCACFDFSGRLLLLVNLQRFAAASQQDFFQAMAYFVRDSLLVAGLSREFTGIHQLAAALEQTELALELGLKHSPTLWYFRFDDYILSYLLSSCTTQFQGEQLCSKKLLFLREHDQKKNTDYYRTLLTFFECRFNAVAAAKKLFLHRSSFLSRMERIRELISIDFDSYDEILYLELSFRLLEKT